MEKILYNILLRLNSGRVGWFFLFIVCAWPIGLIGQSSEEPNNTAGRVKPKTTIYYDGYFSILIDAPVGVKLQVQESFDLNDWKPIAVILIEDGPVMFSPSTTLEGSRHFFRVKQIEGSDDTLGSDNANVGNDGRDNSEGPDVGKPDNPLNPDFTHENPSDSVFKYTDINTESDLAKALANQLLAAFESQKLQLQEVKSAQEMTTEEMSKSYLIQTSAKDRDGNEYLVSGDFKIDKNGEQKLMHIDVQQSINPKSDLAKRLVKLVLDRLREKALELKVIHAVYKISDNHKEFIFVNLELKNTQGDVVMAFGEFEDNGQGDPKLIQVNAYGEDEALNPTDSLDPDDIDDGIDVIEQIDTESDLGQALIKAVIVKLEDAGLELMTVNSMNRVKYGDKQLNEAMLHAKDEDGKEVLVIAVAVETGDGSFKILNINITPNDPGGP